MECAADNLALLLARELIEVNSIARNADGKVGVGFGIFIGLYQGFAVENINIYMMCHLGKVAIENGNKVMGALFIGVAESLGVIEKVLEIPSRQSS